jgi:hypothetical protein
MNIRQQVHRHCHWARPSCHSQAEDAAATVDAMVMAAMAAEIALLGTLAAEGDFAMIGFPWSVLSEFERYQQQ